MADIQVSSIPNLDIWKQKPQVVKDAELDAAFEIVWRDCLTEYREAELSRVHILLTEMNRRSARQNYRLSIGIAILALTVALLSFGVGISIRGGNARFNKQVIESLNEGNEAIRDLTSKFQQLLDANTTRPQPSIELKKVNKHNRG